MRKIEYDIKWGIAKQAPVYSKESGGCQLCLEEKTFIMYADKERSLNKRTEIMQFTIYQYLFNISNVYVYLLTNVYPVPE